jgi:phthalate 4,5-cis-dihydrodiol dehydrogenase
MRQSADGISLYTDELREEISIPPHRGRTAELIELRDVFPNREWGKANLEICLAILSSARENRDVELHHQMPPSSPVSRQ